MNSGGGKGNVVKGSHQLFFGGIGEKSRGDFIVPAVFGKRIIENIPAPEFLCLRCLLPFLCQAHIRQHKEGFVFSCQCEGLLGSGGAQNAKARQACTQNLPQFPAAAEQDLGLLGIDKEPADVFRTFLQIDREMDAAQLRQGFFEMVLSPESAQAVDLIFTEKLRLGTQDTGIRPASLRKENGGGQKAVKIDTDPVLLLKHSAETLQFRLADPLPVIGAQVVEHEKKTGGQAGTDGGGEIGLLGGRIQVGHEGAQNALPGKRGQASGRRLLVELPSGVGGEDDHGVAEIDIFVRKIVVQTASVQNLQEKLNGVAVGFFDLVDQEQTAGMFLNKSGEHTRLGVLEAGGETDEVQMGLMVGIGAHIQLLVRQVQGRGGALGHEGLADAGRTREDKKRPGTLAACVGSGKDLRAEQALRQCVNSVVLAVHCAQELISHISDA